MTGAGLFFACTCDGLFVFTLLLGCNWGATPPPCTTVAVEGEGGVFSIVAVVVVNVVLDGGEPNNVDNGGRGKLPARENKDVEDEAPLSPIAGGEGCITTGMQVDGSPVSE